MKRYLLLGGAGFLGRGLLSTFSMHDSQDIFHVYTPNNTNISLLKQDICTIHYGLISEIDKVRHIIVEHKIDVVIHFVSTMLPGSSFDNYEYEYNHVIFPSIQIMRLCSENNVLFVYFSSGGTVYGNQTDVPKFYEALPLRPISYYGWSKQIMENAILFIHRTEKLNYMIFRPSNPYGPGQNLFGNQGFISVCLGKIISGSPINIWGDGNAIRDYIYIDDFCECIYLLLNSDAVNETFNIGSSIGHSQNEIIRILRDVVPIDFVVEYKPSRNVDVNRMVLDTSKAKNICSYYTRSLKEGISEYWDYLSETL